MPQTLPSGSENIFTVAVYPVDDWMPGNYKHISGVPGGSIEHIRKGQSKIVRCVG